MKFYSQSQCFTLLTYIVTFRSMGRNAGKFLLIELKVKGLYTDQEEEIIKTICAFEYYINASPPGMTDPPGGHVWLSEEMITLDMQVFPQGPSRVLLRSEDLSPLHSQSYLNLPQLSSHR